MSAFGFDSAVTTLANFGASRSNYFDINAEDPCNLHWICEQITVILNLLSRRGFKINKPSRAELMLVNQQILTELRDIRKVMQRSSKSPGGYHGKN